MSDDVQTWNAIEGRVAMMREQRDEIAAERDRWQRLHKAEADAHHATGRQLDRLAAERDRVVAYARRLEDGIRQMSAASARYNAPIVLHTRLIDDARRDAGVTDLMRADDTPQPPGGAGDGV